MRRGRAACGPGFRVRACAESAAPAGEAPGLSMRTASSQTQRSEPERGGRPGAAPGRAPFTCEKSPRREEAPPTPTHTRQPPRPPCQRAWLLLPPPRSHPLLPFPAPPVLSKPRVSSSPPPSALPGLQADLSGENHPATHTAPPLVPFFRISCWLSGVWGLWGVCVGGCYLLLFLWGSKGAWLFCLGWGSYSPEHPSPASSRGTVVLNCSFAFSSIFSLETPG